MPPTDPPNVHADYTDGMSLRDYFAAAALPAATEIAFAASRGNVHADAVQMAYEIADAMLAEREKVRE